MPLQQLSFFVTLKNLTKNIKRDTLNGYKTEKHENPRAIVTARIPQQPTQKFQLRFITFN